MNAAIREAAERELPECADVIRQSFLTVAEEFGITPENAPRYVAYAVSADALKRQREEQHRTLCAAVTEAGAVIGFYSLKPEEAGACELGNLCVLPAYRHGGLGAALLQDALKRAREAGFTKMTLSIVEENTVLRRWYEGFGFRHTGTQKFDFFPFTCGYLETDIEMELTDTER